MLVAAALTIIAWVVSMPLWASIVITVLAGLHVLNKIVLLACRELNTID